ncbi:alpha/beta hydrolase [Dactylosporangium sp. CA-139066]|uniref:alpha/beta hydrolase n=1 Tax=Dactylosporangium sp. CA-139066 TaxID=3239930 RepID=UPI003D906677
MAFGYLLVHSPLVGPRTWAGVADRLETAAVPSLADIGAGGPPFWPRIVRAAAEGAAALPPDRPVVLVVHSSAGLFVPVLVRDLPRTPAAVVFVEAALPARTGPTHPATPQRLTQLRAMAEDGLLPRWTDWWGADDIARMLPDEQPRLPLSYYEHPVPNPPGWEALVRGYIRFSAPYADRAADARDRGWPVVHLPGGHLHQLVDPAAVATAITGLAAAAAPR